MKPVSERQVRPCETCTHFISDRPFSYCKIGYGGASKYSPVPEHLRHLSRFAFLEDAELWPCINHILPEEVKELTDMFSKATISITVRAGDEITVLSRMEHWSPMRFYGPGAITILR